MNILCIDNCCMLLDFAMRAIGQGHAIKHWMPPVKAGAPNRLGEGMVTRIRSWEANLLWADLIVVSDNTKWLATFDSLKAKGYPIFAPSVTTARWELDRQHGQELLARVGVPVLDAQRFTSYRRALEWVRANPGRYVAKPNGDADRALSYVAKGQQDLEYMLDKWARKPPKKPDFVIQPFTPGTEFAVGGWFGPGGWSGWWMENFEHKKLMPGEIGPNTGEMGTALHYTQDSELARRVLEPLTGELHRSGHTGYIDVAVIVDERGRPWPLEFTSRFGHPLWHIQQVLHPDIAGWMLALVDGDSSAFKPREDFAVGVVIGLNDFPYAHKAGDYADGVPLFNHERITEWLHPDDARMGEALGQPILMSAGIQPAIVTGRGASVAEAQERAYKHVKTLNIPASPLYRNDIADRKLDAKIKALKQHGFAESWRYA